MLLPLPKNQHPGQEFPDQLILGGLGFGQKWMMGWMHDTLKYFKLDPVHRKYHQNEITFSIMYAFTENFMLPFHTMKLFMVRDP